MAQLSIDLGFDEEFFEKAKEEEKLSKARRENERIRAQNRIDVAENLIKAKQKYLENRNK